MHPRHLLFAFVVLSARSSQSSAQQLFDIAGSAQWQRTQLTLDPGRKYAFNGLAVNIAPRFSLVGASHWAPVFGKAPLKWTRIQIPDVALGANALRGISLTTQHDLTATPAFSYFEWFGARVEMRPFVHLGAFAYARKGLRTTEEFENGTLWNRFGDGVSSGVGLFVPMVEGRGLTISAGRLRGTLDQQERLGKVSPMAERSLSAKQFSIGWGGRFTGADLPSIPLFRYPRTWAINIENDAFGGAISDSAYTQGLQVSWNIAYFQPSLLRWTKLFSFVSLIPSLAKQSALDFTTACGSEGHSTRACQAVQFGFGQTEYTPDTLQLPQRFSDRRPYAAFLYGTAGSSLTFAHGRVSTQVQIGTTGPPALGEDAQSFAHWTWAHDRPRPAGWSNQLRAQPHIMLVNQYEGRFPWMGWCAWKQCRRQADEVRIADLTLRGQTDLGTLMLRASPGAALRVGVNFPDVSTLQRLPVSLTLPLVMAPAAGVRNVGAGNSAKRFWVVGYAGADARFIPYNALLTGSRADKGEGGWRNVTTIDPKPLVTEWSWGGSGGFGFLTIGYQRVHRSSEYDPSGGVHRYGAFSVAINSGY